MQDKTLPKVYGDFETRCDLDLTEVGTERYLRHPSADIVFYTYRIEVNGVAGPVTIWWPGDELPEFFSDPTKYLHYHFNSQFDERVKRYIGAKYGIKEAPLDNQVDVMALCGRYTFPQKLEKAAEALQTPTRKAAGLALIKKICMPPYKYTHEDFNAFVSYGKDDTLTTYDVVKALPLDMLSEYEHEVWKHTVLINQRGLPIDVPVLKAVVREVQSYQKRGVRELATCTQGKVTAPGQVARIRKYLLERWHLDLPNLQAETVDKYLDNPKVPEGAKLLLQLRKDLGPAAAKKFIKLASVQYRWRCYDNQRYYAGHTGRWGGMGFQLHNLPRAKSKTPYALAKKFLDGTIQDEGGVLISARKMVRHMIRPYKDRLLGVNDFSSIENRLLAWFTGDQKALQLFRDGGDQYKDMAAARFNVPYDEVDKDQRFTGKVIILGCGYGMGWEKFQDTAMGFGLVLSNEEAQLAVGAYRAKYPEVPKMWYGTYSAAVAAIRHPGSTFQAYKCKFRVLSDRTKRHWLQLTLPSKGVLYYCEPFLEGTDYRPQIMYAGINGYTKKWDLRKRIIPGLLVENIIQATARDYMAEAVFMLERAEIPVIGMIHDEVLTELTYAFVKEYGIQTSKVIGNIMCHERSWCPDLPMNADGFVARHYRKD